MPERSDPLTLTLDALQSDVERTPLADSLAVRRRGDQRTRRQAVGGALAVVALVAAAVGVAGGLTGSERTTQVPATQTPTPTAEKTLGLAAQPLLDPADLGALGVYDGWQANPDPAAADQQLSLCVPSPSSFAAADSASRLYYTDLDARATEHVLRFASSDAAAVAVDELTHAFAACDPGDPAEQVSDREPQAVAVPGADALHASRSAAPPESELSYYEVGVATKANVVVVLQWSSMGRPDGVDWVWDSARLTSALDRAVR
jgi:hypothetical protein